MDKVHAILLFRYSVFMLNKINGKVLDFKLMDHFPSHAGDEEEDRQEPVERVGLLHPGGADQGLHGGEPEPQEGERRPLLCQGHDAQVVFEYLMLSTKNVNFLLFSGTKSLSAGRTSAS